VINDDRPMLRDQARYDVIVVGGRAAGASTAMLLARAGLRTLLLERGTFGSDTLSTHALMRAGVLQLARWGVLDRIVSAGTPAIRSTSFRYADQHIRVPIKAANGVDALYAPRRFLLDAVLVQAAAEAGAEVIDRTNVVDVLRRGGRVAGVVVTTDSGGFVELRAPLVIGADGVRSTVARAVDAPKVRVARSTTATTYGYWDGVDAAGYEWVFAHNVASGFIPTNDGQLCVFAGGTRERIGRGGVATILDIVDTGAPELGERLRAGTAPAATRTWPGQAGYLRRAWGPGWALVGDAGYFKDPISAHGITDALRDAELLARAVVEGHGEERATDERLLEYETTRDALSLPLFGVVEEIAANEWDEERIAELLVELSASMADEVATLVGLDEPDVATPGMAVAR
jgi:2-polyprenyl-6-methoxyphenol hydroxylase-like FAD-dependent oxidoreductase